VHNKIEHRNIVAYSGFKKSIKGCFADDDDDADETFLFVLLKAISYYEINKFLTNVCKQSVRGKHFYSAYFLTWSLICA
jgi:hypothetical protein